MPPAAPPPPWIERLPTAAARRPVRTLLLALLCLGLAALSVLRIEPVPSLEPMFDGRDPQAQALVHLLEDFQSADTLLLLVESPPPAAPDVTEPRRSAREQDLLAFARRLETALSATPDHLRFVRGVSYRPGEHFRPFIEQRIAPAGLYYLDDERFEQFLDRLRPEGMAEQIRRNEASITAGGPAADALIGRILQDPLGLSSLLVQSMLGPGEQRSGGAMSQAALTGRPMFSTDGRALLIQVYATEPASDLDFTQAFMPWVRERIAAAEPGDLQIQLAGGHPIAEHSERVIRRDMVVSTVTSVILLHLSFLLIYRGPWVFPAIFLPVAAGIFAGFGVYGLFSPRLTPVIAASGAILAGLGIDYGIHLFAHYQERRARGLATLPAFRRSFHLAPALLAACVTSMLGFLAVAFSRVPALQDFALIGACGLGGAFLASLFVLPALVRLIDRHPKVQQDPLRVRIDPLMIWIGRRPATAALGGGLLLLAAVLSLLLVGTPRFDPELTSLQPQPNPPMEAQAALNTRFPGTLESLPVLLQADSPEALLALAHRVDLALNTSDAVRRGQVQHHGLADLIPDPQQVERRQWVLRGLDAEQVVRDFRAALEPSLFDPQAYLGYEAYLRTMLQTAQPPTLGDLAAYPFLAETLLPRPEARARGAHASITVLELLETPATAIDRARLHTDLARALADEPQAILTGLDVVAASAGRSIRADLQLLLPLALVAVLLWLVWSFRSFTAALLAFVPAAFCLAVLAAAMRVAGIPFNAVNLIALPLLAGIGVDDGIFLVSLARRHRQQRSTTPLGDRFVPSSHAISMTTLTTLLAFGSLLTTRTPAIQSLGFALTIGMAACWFGALFVLAPLLIMLDRRRQAAAVETLR